MLEMGLTALAASGLLALTLGSSGGHGSLQLLSPDSLEVTSALRLPSAELGYASAVRGEELALVVKPVATGQPIRIIDVARMRVERSIQVGDRDVCGLTFVGRMLVALAANQPCYWPGGRFALLRIEPDTGRIAGSRPVRGLHTAFPTNLAFGDGRAFVTRATGGIDAVDLRTGVTTTHRPRRMLAKGERVVATHFLGGHLLGAGPRVVDVRTWRTRLLEPGAHGVVSSGADLIAYGPRGAGIYTRAGRLIRRTLQGEQVSAAVTLDGRLYATVGEAVDTVEIATGTQTHVAPGDWILLAAR
jgi:hypothetical protein